MGGGLRAHKHTANCEGVLWEGEREGKPVLRVTRPVSTLGSASRDETDYDGIDGAGKNLWSSIRSSKARDIRDTAAAIKVAYC